MPAAVRFRFCFALVSVFCIARGYAGDALGQWFTRPYTNHNFESYALSDIIFASGMFVAVGEYGDHGGILTSPDGVNWKFANITNQGIIFSVNGVAYGNGRFVGVGWSGAGKLSFDGTNWSQMAVGDGSTFLDVVYGGGQFVAVGDPRYFGVTPTNTAFSTDGVNWTMRLGRKAILQRVAYGDGVFLAVGPEGAVRSTGSHFNPVSDLPFSDVAFGNGVFVLLGPTNIFVRAPSVGSSIPPFASVTNLPATRLVFENGMFFAMNTNGSAMYTSTNATNWIAHEITPALGAFEKFAIAQGAGTLVAVAHGNRIWQSAPLAHAVMGANKGELQVSGVVGAGYRVETRNDFHANSPWLPAGNLILSNSPQTWMDLEATNYERRFYRTQLLP